MQKWEHMYVLVVDTVVKAETVHGKTQCISRQSWATYLESAGEDGWEMCGFSTYIVNEIVFFHVVFKRPAQGIGLD